MAAITDLSSLSDAASGDLLVIHDVSDSTDKKITRSLFFTSEPIPFDGFIMAGGTTTIANDASVGLTTVISGAPASMNGIVFIVNASTGQSAIYYMSGGNNTAVEMSDPANVFSPTSGTASSSNFYYSSGYGLQNKTGSNKTYFLVYIGTA